VTRLQFWTRALAGLVEDAKDELDERSYSWFIAIACEAVGVEAARFVVVEAIHATRDESEAA